MAANTVTVGVVKYILVEQARNQSERVVRGDSENGVEVFLDPIRDNAAVYQDVVHQLCTRATGQGVFGDNFRGTAFLLVSTLGSGDYYFDPEDDNIVDTIRSTQELQVVVQKLPQVPLRLPHQPDAAELAAEYGLAESPSIGPESLVSHTLQKNAQPRLPKKGVSTEQRFSSENPSVLAARIPFCSLPAVILQFLLPDIRILRNERVPSACLKPYGGANMLCLQSDEVEDSMVVWNLVLECSHGKKFALVSFNKTPDFVTLYRLSDLCDCATKGRCLSRMRTSEDVTFGIFGKLLLQQQECAYPIDSIFGSKRVHTVTRMTMRVLQSKGTPFENAVVPILLKDSRSPSLAVRCLSAVSRRRANPLDGVPGFRVISRRSRSGISKRRHPSATVDYTQAMDFYTTMFSQDYYIVNQTTARMPAVAFINKKCISFAMECGQDGTWNKLLLIQCQDSVHKLMDRKGPFGILTINGIPCVGWMCGSKKQDIHTLLMDAVKAKIKDLYPDYLPQVLIADMEPALHAPWRGDCHIVFCLWHHLRSISAPLKQIARLFTMLFSNKDCGEMQELLKRACNGQYKKDVKAIIDRRGMLLHTNIKYFTENLNIPMKYLNGSQHARIEYTSHILKRVLNGILANKGLSFETFSGFSADERKPFVGAAHEIAHLMLFYLSIFHRTNMISERFIQELERSSRSGYIPFKEVIRVMNEFFLKYQASFGASAMLTRVQQPPPFDGSRKSAERREHYEASLRNMVFLPRWGLVFREGHRHIVIFVLRWSRIHGLCTCKSCIQSPLSESRPACVHVAAANKVLTDEVGDELSMLIGGGCDKNTLERLEKLFEDHPLTSNGVLLWLKARGETVKELLTQQIAKIASLTGGAEASDEEEEELASSRRRGAQVRRPRSPTNVGPPTRQGGRRGPSANGGWGQMSTRGRHGSYHSELSQSGRHDWYF